MPSANQNIAFAYGTDAGYQGIGSKNANTVYFTTDTQRLFVGDIEYTRPVQHGADLPDGYLPPNSLFVLETGSVRDLYFSEDGASWTMIAHLPAAITGGVFGNNAGGAVSFGGTITVPKVTVDTRGAVTAIEDVTVTLPSETAETQLSYEESGSGNAVTGVAVEGHKITVTKGETFATQQQLTDAIGGITDFEIDSNEGVGYATLDALEEAHATGTPGVFYLVVNPDAEANNAFLEYFWTGTAYELAGQFGATNTSDLVTSEQLTEALDDKVDKTVTVNGQPLSGNVNITKVDEAAKVTNALTINGQAYDGSAAVNITTPDQNTTYTFANGANGSFTVTPSSGEPQTVNIGKPATAGAADTAAKLAAAVQLSLIGDATGTVTFDGSEGSGASKGVSMTVDVVHATAADNDEDGNNIKTTYATKSEVTAASLKWTTF